MKLTAGVLLLALPAFTLGAEHSAPGKASIVITSEPLRGNTADVEINGKRVAAVGPDQPYKGMYDAGKIVITTRGGRAEVDALPNKEYVFEIVMKGSTAGAVMFGLLGASSMADYPIALKETKDLAQ